MPKNNTPKGKGKGGKLKNKSPKTKSPKGKKKSPSRQARKRSNKRKKAAEAAAAKAASAAADNEAAKANAAEEAAVKATAIARGKAVVKIKEADEAAAEAKTAAATKAAADAKAVKEEGEAVEAAEAAKAAATAQAAYHVARAQTGSIDGVIGKTEFAMAGGTKEEFDRSDINHDGVLDAEELDHALEEATDATAAAEAKAFVEAKEAVDAKAAAQAAAKVTAAAEATWLATEKEAVEAKALLQAANRRQKKVAAAAVAAAGKALTAKDVAEATAAEMAAFEAADIAEEKAALEAEEAVERRAAEAKEAVEAAVETAAKAKSFTPGQCVQVVTAFRSNKYLRNLGTSARIGHITQYNLAKGTYATVSKISPGGGLCLEIYGAAASIFTAPQKIEPYPWIRPDQYVNLAPASMAHQPFTPLVTAGQRVKVVTAFRCKYQHNKQHDLTKGMHATVGSILPDGAVCLKDTVPQNLVPYPWIGPDQTMNLAPFTSEEKFEAADEAKMLADEREQRMKDRQAAEKRRLESARFLKLVLAPDVAAEQKRRAEEEARAIAAAEEHRAAEEANARAGEREAEHQKTISKASKKLSCFFRRVKMMNRFSAIRTTLMERVAKLKALNTMAVKELGDGAKNVVLDLGKGKVILQQNIIFMPGTAIIEQKSVKFVETIAHVLRTVAKIIDREGATLDLGQIKYVVDGHTHASAGKDPLAPKAVLMSFNRAKSVMEHLVASGVNASHLFAHGFGGSRTLGGKAHDDRRVEISVISPTRAHIHGFSS